ncbi:hypothetical protein Tco_1316697 [Tanacetum coccineum]
MGKVVVVSAEVVAAEVGSVDVAAGQGSRGGDVGDVDGGDKGEGGGCGVVKVAVERGGVWRGGGGEGARRRVGGWIE